ncbi:winged helix-turn-helix domain-containing protein [Streptomyces sp. BYX5S]
MSSRTNRTKKKGRRHRTVNRTPRPVTRREAAVEPGATPTAAAVVPGQGSGPDLDRVLDRLGYGRLRFPAPTPAPASAPAPVSTPAPAPKDTVAEPSPEQAQGVANLAKNTRLTLDRLAGAAHGLTLEQLCEEVGWTPRTVARHLKKLADGALAEQAEDGRWFASTKAAALSHR